MHDLIITKPQLYDRLISVYVGMTYLIYNLYDRTSEVVSRLELRSTLFFYCSEVGEYRVMGCPKCIDDKKYERNAFIFNFVFVFSSSINTSAYEPVIQKMGNAFRTYEVQYSIPSII